MYSDSAGFGVAIPCGSRDQSQIVPLGAPPTGCPTGWGPAECGGQGTMTSEKKWMNRSILLAKNMVPKAGGVLSTRAP